MGNERQNRQKKNGFTLIELIVTMALFSILLGVSVYGLVQWKDNSRFSQQNEYAQTLFIAAQNQLTEYSRNGSLEEFQNKIKISEQPDGAAKDESENKYSRTLDINALTDGEGNAYNAEDVWTAKEGTLCYISCNAGDYEIYSSSEDEEKKEALKERGADVLFELLSSYVYDQSILNDSISMEFSPDGGQVFAVCFSDKASELAYDGLDDGGEHVLDDEGAANISCRKEEHRRENMVGYYGADTLSVANDTSGEKPVLDNVTLNNEETLNLSFQVLRATGAAQQLKYSLNVYDQDTKQLALSLTIDGTQLHNSAHRNSVKSSVQRYYYSEENGQKIQKTQELGEYDILAWVDADETVRIVLDAADIQATSYQYLTDLGNGLKDNTEANEGKIADLLFTSTYSFHRFGIDAEHIYCTIQGYGENYQTTSIKQSNAEAVYFATAQINSEDAVYTENINNEESTSDGSTAAFVGDTEEYFSTYTLTNARHLYNVRFVEDLSEEDEAEYEHDGIFIQNRFEVTQNIDWDEFVANGNLYYTQEGTTNLSQDSVKDIVEVDNWDVLAVKLADKSNTNTDSADTADSTDDINVASSSSNSATIVTKCVFPSIRQLRYGDTFSGNLAATLKASTGTATNAANTDKNKSIANLTVTEIGNVVCGVYLEDMTEGSVNSTEVSQEKTKNDANDNNKNDGTDSNNTENDASTENGIKDDASDESKSGEEKSENNYPVGLFVRNYGTISDLKLDNMVVEGQDKVGTFCGESWMPVKNLEVASSSDVSSVTGNHYVGGVIGYQVIEAENQEIFELANLKNDAKVTGMEKVGGIVGEIDLPEKASMSVTVRNCENSGAVIAKDSYAGGIMTENYGTVKNCINTGTVISGESGNAGGIVAENYATVQKCVNSGNVSAWNGNGGGISAYNHKDAVIKECTVQPEEDESEVTESKKEEDNQADDNQMDAKDAKSEQEKDTEAEQAKSEQEKDTEAEQPKSEQEKNKDTEAEQPEKLEFTSQKVVGGVVGYNEGKILNPQVSQITVRNYKESPESNIGIIVGVNAKTGSVAFTSEQNKTDDKSSDDTKNDIIYISDSEAKTYSDNSNVGGVAGLNLGTIQGESWYKEVTLSEGQEDVETRTFDKPKSWISCSIGYAEDSAPSANLGGVVGKNEGMIENIGVKDATIQAATGSKKTGVGGVVGMSAPASQKDDAVTDKPKVNNCTFDGTVSASNPSSKILYLGGIVGLNQADSTIYGCRIGIEGKKTTITAGDENTAAHDSYVGGIAGNTYGDIIDCDSYHTDGSDVEVVIEASGGIVAGIAGVQQKGASITGEKDRRLSTGKSWTIRAYSDSGKYTVAGIVGMSYSNEAYEYVSNYANLYALESEYQESDDSTSSDNKASDTGTEQKDSISSADKASDAETEQENNIVQAGLVGCLQATSTQSVHFTYCYNYGALQAMGQGSSGGMIGQLRYGGIMMETCKNYGKISKAQYTGGMIGSIYSALTDIEIYNCENHGNLYGSVEAAGMIAIRLGTHLEKKKSEFVYYNCVNTGLVGKGNNARSAMGTALDETDSEMITGYYAQCQNYGYAAKGNGFTGIQNGTIIRDIVNCFDLGGGDFAQSEATDASFNNYFVKFTSTSDKNAGNDTESSDSSASDSESELNSGSASDSDLESSESSALDSESESSNSSALDSDLEASDGSALDSGLASSDNSAQKKDLWKKNSPIALIYKDGALYNGNTRTSVKDLTTLSNGSAGETAYYADQADYDINASADQQNLRYRTWLEMKDKVANYIKSQYCADNLTGENTGKLDKVTGIVLNYRTNAGYYALKWNQVEQAYSYEVVYIVTKADGSTVEKTVEVVGIGRLHIEKEELIDATNLRVKIVAKDGCGKKAHYSNTEEDIKMQRGKVMSQSDEATANSDEMDTGNSETVPDSTEKEADETTAAGETEAIETTTDASTEETEPVDETSKETEASDKPTQEIRTIEQSTEASKVTEKAGSMGESTKANKATDETGLAGESIKASKTTDEADSAEESIKDETGLTDE